MTTDNHNTIETFIVTVEPVTQVFEIVLVPAFERNGYRRREHLELRIPDQSTPRGYRSYQGWNEFNDLGPKGVKKLRKKAEAHITQSAESARIYPVLLQILQATGGFESPGRELAPDEVAVGDTVVIHSRGKYRPVLITHITRTGTITGAYITQGGLDEAQRYGGPAAEAGITRKTAKVGSYFARGAH